MQRGRSPSLWNALGALGLDGGEPAGYGAWPGLGWPEQSNERDMAAILALIRRGWGKHVS